MTEADPRDERIAAFLNAAEHLETWAEALPRWSQHGQEPWFVFADHRYEAEVALMERLRRAPNCQLKTCRARLHVELTLGGLSVKADQGLSAAIQEWARRARGRASAARSALSELAPTA